MRVLLDENLPVELATALTGHTADTVSGLGWEGVTNGELLSRMRGQFDALLTMDVNLEFQQPLAKQPFGTVLVRASSNRMVHLSPLVPSILSALDALKPGDIRIGCPSPWPTAGGRWRGRRSH